MTKSLEHLDSDMTSSHNNKPVLVQVSSRSQSTVDTVASQPLVAQYSVRSETSIAKVRTRIASSSSAYKIESPSTSSPYKLDSSRKKSEGSMARIASAEDMRIETETVVVSPTGGGHGFSTVV